MSENVEYYAHDNNRSIEKKRIKQKIKGTCLECKRSFVGVSYKKYCSKQCRVTHGKPKQPETLIVRSLSKNYPFTCLNCKTGPQYGRFAQKYCNTACRLSMRSNAFAGKEIATGDKGAISELIICVKLMTHGWDVFRALSPMAKFDIIAVRNNKPVFIEVRTGTSNKETNKLVGFRSNEDLCHVYAVTDGGPSGFIEINDGTLPIDQETIKELQECVK